ncbi:uncharacterized protein VTP21DRAFT_4902 [Calcarisporiella thermophila]|uniref:uncharacterized protein n=1 Tax=Calcarisporiella thermophila TaxID=911321 RepID=UPI0037440241
MATAPANGSPNTASANGQQQQQQKILPFEVGMMFVHEYYTFVNREPERLHCFYSKKSSMIHGTEGESVEQCQGQQEIHKKIIELSFQDCKVKIFNVDSQPSHNGGIVIQVLGEMSNNDGPYRKFAQTFFLAEQPNGYYVLNDIFRYLKESTAEEEEEYEDEVEDESTTQEKQIEAQDVAKEEVKEESKPEPVAAEPIAAAPSAAEGTSVTDQKEPVEKVGTPTPVKEEAAVATEKKPSSDKKKHDRSSQPSAGAAASTPKTWANLAARNVDQWGTNVSAAKGTSTPAPEPKSQKAPTQSGKQKNQENNQKQQQQQQPQSASNDAQLQPQQQDQDEGFKTVQGQRQSRGRRYEDGGDDKRRSGDYRGGRGFQGGDRRNVRGENGERRGGGGGGSGPRGGRGGRGGNRGGGRGGQTH